jgi:hypothetical protein
MQLGLLDRQIKDIKYALTNPIRLYYIPWEINSALQAITKSFVNLNSSQTYLTKARDQYIKDMSQPLVTMTDVNINFAKDQDLAEGHRLSSNQTNTTKKRQR